MSKENCIFFFLITIVYIKRGKEKKKKGKMCDIDEKELKKSTFAILEYYTI
jgi:hypothetical protein